MGGGDLNLKKSWHPQTIRNVERVWKAEQKASAETKKIEQLQRELTEERAREDMQRHAVQQGVSKKKSERLEWMYATPGQVDREQYLLGKTIDKHVDPLANTDKEDSNVPGASSVVTANTPADLAAKVRDDPLFLIKKKEEEKKKELLNNPMKMKHLRQMLQENLGKSKKKKEKKKKKDKKEKRRKAKDSDKSSDSDDERRQKHRRKHDRDASPETHRQNSASRSRKRRSPSQSPDRDTYTSPPRYSHSKKRRSQSSSPQRTKPQKYTTHSRQSRSRSVDRKRRQRRRPSTSPSPHRHRQNHSRSPVRNGHKNGWSGSPKRNSSRSYSPSHKKSRKPSPPRRSSRHESRSPPRKGRLPSPKRNQHSRGSAVTKKMSAEELERRREEMLSNAQWRNDQRTANVTKHTEIQKKEAEDEAHNAGKSAKFLSSMKVESFSSDSTASVSDRIKRNINSLQRTAVALDTFLVKK